MSFRTALVLAAVSAVIVAWPASAQNPPPPSSQTSSSGSSQSGGKTDLIFCNNTGTKLFTAIVYYEPGTKRWMLSAWGSRNPGECKSAGTFQAGLVYYFAENEGRRLHWPAKANKERDYCVPSQAVMRAIMPGQSCAQGERLVGFRSINLKGPKHTMNFNNS